MSIQFIPAKNHTPASYIQPPGRRFLLIVIHWVAGSFTSCIKWFQAQQNNKSSAHYVISEKGETVRMVEEDAVAWHCGVSAWKDYPTYGHWTSLNPCSIGIELAGPPSMIGLTQWSQSQIDACAALCREIKTRHPEIKIVDHSRICSTKIDVIKGTGYTEDVFPWKELVQKSGVEEA